MIIYDREYIVDRSNSRRVDPIGDLITPKKWTEVKTPIKFNDLNERPGRHDEYQRFNDWFEKKCTGYYQYLYRGTFLFSDEGDVIRYYLGYYYD